jgi:UDP-N-acetylglucosamine acyltransferase
LADIHPTAVVDPGARLDSGVTVGAFAVIERNVEIGKGTSIGPHALIADGARIGVNCVIHNGAAVATLPQDLKFGGEETRFEIGDHTTIREFCTLNRGTLESGKSSIGKNGLLMAYAHVAHDCAIGDNVILANGVQLGGHVHIGDWAIIGGMTPVHQFCHIGAHCMVGGGYRVIKDVPPFILASGEPMRFGGLNAIGLRRRGFDAATLATLKKAYRLIYRSKLNVSQAVERIKHELDLTPEVRQILDFIEHSDRGLI